MSEVAPIRIGEQVFPTLTDAYVAAKPGDVVVIGPGRMEDPLRRILWRYRPAGVTVEFLVPITYHNEERAVA